MWDDRNLGPCSRLHSHCVGEDLAKNRRPKMEIYSDLQMECDKSGGTSAFHDTRVPAA